MITSSICVDEGLAWPTSLLPGFSRFKWRTFHSVCDPQKKFSLLWAFIIMLLWCMLMQGRGRMWMNLPFVCQITAESLLWMRAQSAFCVAARSGFIPAPLSKPEAAPCCIVCQLWPFLKEEIGAVRWSGFALSHPVFTTRLFFFFCWRENKGVSVTLIEAESESPLVCVFYSLEELCTVSVCSLTVYTTKLTRAHRGSLPTPKQIMQVLVGQEKARGNWRAARYLRFIFPLD